MSWPCILWNICVQIRLEIQIQIWQNIPEIISVANYVVGFKIDTWVMLEHLQ